METKWYRFNATDKISTYQRQGISVKTPVQEKIYFSDDVVETFSLEPRNLNNVVPFNQDYTGIPNYFLDYWGYILGMKAAYTWIRYVRHVYRPGFELFRSLSEMAEIMGIAKNTLKEYISILESYGFLAVFYKDVKSQKGGTIETHISVKVRKTIPFLTPELVERLPIKLQKNHKDDIANFEKTSSITYEEFRGIDAIFGLNISTPGQNLTPLDETEGDLSIGGQKITSVNEPNAIHAQSNFDLTPGNNLTPEKNISQEDYLNINTSDFWKKIMAILKAKLSQRALDTFFTIIQPFIDSGILILSSNNSLALSWVEERYGDLLKSIVTKIDQNIHAIKYVILEV